jgi:hypothetical protein
MLVALAAAMSAMSGAAAQTPAGGRAGAPLTLQARCDTRGQAPMLHVRIANTSGQPVSFLLGFVAAKEKARVVNAVMVITIRPATGADEAHVYVNPKHALETGAPWIETLAPGAAHELQLPIVDFISSNTFANLDPTAAGGARFVLEARPAPKGSGAVWTGTVETKIDACP